MPRDSLGREEGEGREIVMLSPAGSSSNASAPGGAAEIETYFRESRTWFFFSASASAFAPEGPMELLRRLGRGRGEVSRKDTVSKAREGTVAVHQHVPSSAECCCGMPGSGTRLSPAPSGSQEGFGCTGTARSELGGGNTYSSTIRLLLTISDLASALAPLLLI